VTREGPPYCNHGFVATRRGNNSNINWTDVAAVVIAALALVVSIGSAVAACGSNRTAQQSVDIARQAAEVSGAVPSIGDKLTLSGACGDSRGIIATIHLINHGHIGTSIKSAEVLVYKDADSTHLSQVGGNQDMDLAILPENTTDVPLTVSCESLQSIGIGARSASELAPLIGHGRWTFIASGNFGNGSSRQLVMTSADTG
jgi:hypothetical protein